MNRSAFERCYRLLTGGAAALVLSVMLGLAGWLLWASVPALRETGVMRFLFGSVWSPQEGRYGIFPMVLSSLLLAAGATAAAAPVAVGAACFFRVLCPEWAARIFLRGVMLLSGLPSVLYGLVGMTCVVPAIAQRCSAAGRSGGASLLAAFFVLAAMILPSLVLQSFDALCAGDRRMALASDALGATKTQTIVSCLIPSIAPQRRIASGAALCRAMGEATAVLLVSGNVVQMPALLSPTRTLAGTLVLEMGYASGVHRSALFAIGLVLLLMAAAIPTKRTAP
jgi:phosphate transport system permease protein